jgi:hypothetical protein
MIPEITFQTLIFSVSKMFAAFGRNKWLQPIPALLFLFATSIQAASYKWTDRDGSLHFSDTPPAYEVPQKSLSIEDHEQRPLMGKGLVIYQDRVFKIVLSDEQDDKLHFKVSYNNIQRAYPEVIRGNTLIYICATQQDRTYTYLAYTVAPVEGGSTTLSLVNGLSKQSPSRLVTDSLHMTLYRDDRKTKEFKILFKKAIPFSKVWEKQAGVVY